MYSIASAQRPIVPRFCSHRLRAWGWLCRNMHREKRCGSRISFGRQGRYSLQCETTGTVPGKTDVSTMNVETAVTPKRRPATTGPPERWRDCEACGGTATLGPARQWLRPPGFAHPVFKEEGTSPDDQPARSYATRAKLTMHTPPYESKWDRLNSSIRIYPTREHLLITNRGPREEGYAYCVKVWPH